MIVTKSGQKFKTTFNPNQIVVCTGFIPMDKTGIEFKTLAEALQKKPGFDIMVSTDLGGHVLLEKTIQI